MLALIFVLLIIVGGVFLKKSAPEYDDGFALAGFLCFFASTIVFTVSLFILMGIGTVFVIDEKIAMYEEENARIEQIVDSVVKEYIEYEYTTFTELKTTETEAVIALAMFYPELESNTLVQKQLETYISNNNKIKELREKKIDISKKKWILYFGR
ncbi:hypothetical protein IKF03_02300 [Candidatus Saccharibacteria bacterium]|nr:hypothetical protein [Candidatus Saccharibacteria bacterium]